jgi:hypothetical protein
MAQAFKNHYFHLLFEVPNSSKPINPGTHFPLVPEVDHRIEKNKLLLFVIKLKQHQSQVNVDLLFKKQNTIYQSSSKLITKSLNQ